MGQWVGSGQMTNNCISLDLIEIIQFSVGFNGSPVVRD